MQGEEKFSVGLRLLIDFDVGSFKLKAEVTPQKLDRLACYINMAHQQRRARSLSGQGRWTMVVIERGESDERILDQSEAFELLMSVAGAAFPV